MKKLNIPLLASCVCSLALLFGCSAQAQPPSSDVPEVPPVEEVVPPVEEEVPPSEETPPIEEETPPEPVYAEYVKITGDSVNMRSGAGTSYSVTGIAQKGEIYALSGKSGNWVKTYYRNKTVFVYADYCAVVTIERSQTDSVESVIEEGARCLGVPYVYGATRYLDENGNRIKGFSASKFDCSSLMQYAFKLGADKNLKLTTRTQIYQGVTVKKSQISRGDLLFFTNDSRRYETGTERVGHVALYLGDNYILHTASDYARIEQISAKRWSYYIQAQRIL